MTAETLLEKDAAEVSKAEATAAISALEEAGNGLKVLEEVCPLSARMVVNQVSMKMENERIRKLIEDLRRVLQEEM